MADNAETALARVLRYVPYMAARPGVELATVCDHFEISRRRLLEDLDMLLMCGLPPYGPGDLFEWEIEDDRIWLSGVDSICESTGLRRYEAQRMLAAANLASGLAGICDVAELASAAEKLSHAIGEVLVDVTSRSPSVEESSTESLRTAIADRRVVRLVYYTASRDVESTRDVEPWKIFRTDSAGYVVGFCRLAQGKRTFRIDRIRSATPTSETFEPPADATGAHSLQGGRIKATLQLSAGAMWATSRYRVQSQVDLGNGWTEVVVAASAETFLHRMVIGLGARCRVVDPPWLADAVRRRACELAASYRADQPAPSSGSEKWKVDPCPRLDSTQIRPL